jgi:hypothetical protein
LSWRSLESLGTLGCRYSAGLISMITGYNTDVGHHDVVLHVQTEDKGLESASIESLVYVGGQILGKRRTGYRDLVERGEGKEAIMKLMDRQHRLMIAEIRNGSYDGQLTDLGMVVAEDVAAARGAGAGREPIPIVEDDSAEVSGQRAPVASGEGQSLDEIILEYLSSEAEQEHLVLMMEVDREFELGQPATLDLRTKGSLAGDPAAGTRITVKMISTVSEPATLAYGETDAQGELKLALEIPDLKRGSSALIVTASSSIGTAEIKHLL